MLLCHEWTAGMPWEFGGGSYRATGDVSLWPAVQYALSINKKLMVSLDNFSNFLVCHEYRFDISEITK